MADTFGTDIPIPSPASNGCGVVNDVRDVRRCYVQDVNGLIYTLTTRDCNRQT